MKYNINQRVVLKHSPVFEKKGTIIKIEPRYLVKLDNGLAFLVEEDRLQKEVNKPCG